MNADREPQIGQGPVFPRRAFVASALSAVVAGGAVSLGYFGGLGRLETGVFQFSRGLSLASGEHARLMALLALALPDNRIHVTIVGHSGTTGDALANMTLSEERADLVAQYAQDAGLPDECLDVIGVGGGAPLAKNDGESDRAYQARLARVEVSLQFRK